MKHLVLSLVLLLALSTAKSQGKIGPAEQRLTDSICNCMGRIDMSVINTREKATAAFMDCFSKQGALLLPIAAERKVEITNKAAMREIGTDVGKNLLNQNCEPFLRLSMVMAKDKIDQEIDDKTGTTAGKLKRIDTKEFNYVVVTDENGKEKSFIWLRQFDGADLFAANPASLIGKKVLINWTEIEAYVPSAKSYFPLKEIVKISIE